MFSNIFSIHALSGHLIYSPDSESYSLNIYIVQQFFFLLFFHLTFRIAINNLKHSSDLERRYRIEPELEVNIYVFFFSSTAFDFLAIF